MDEMMQKLMRETHAREEAEAELAKERSTLQASLVSLAGRPADPVASLKQRMWSLRHELDTVKSERDELKRICRR
jgi:predicted  nucleic acid-binding Zn-ribbon protein